MKSHWLWMLLACAGPLLLIFMLPSLGVNSDITFFVVIIIFFIAHLFMMRGHSHGHNNQDQDTPKSMDKGSKHSLH